MPKKKSETVSKREKLANEKIEALEREYFSSFHRRRRRKKKEPAQAVYLLAAAVGLLLWYVFSRAFVLEIPFVSLNFVLLLPLLKLMLGGSIFGNFLLLFYRPQKFRYFIQIIQSFLGLIFFYQFFKVFPFDFSSLAYSGTIEMAVRIVLLAALVGNCVITALLGLELALQGKR